MITPMIDDDKPDNTLDAITNIEDGIGNDRDWCTLANAGLIPHLQGSYGRFWAQMVRSRNVERGPDGRWFPV